MLVNILKDSSKCSKEFSSSLHDFYLFSCAWFCSVIHPQLQTISTICTLALSWVKINWAGLFEMDVLNSQLENTSAVRQCTSVIVETAPFLTAAWMSSDPPFCLLPLAACCNLYSRCSPGPHHAVTGLLLLLVVASCHQPWPPAVAVTIFQTAATANPSGSAATRPLPPWSWTLLHILLGLQQFLLLLLNRLVALSFLFPQPHFNACPTRFLTLYKTR